MATDAPRTGFRALLSRLFGRPGQNERKEICHHCGKEASLDRRHCPHCGAPVVPQSRWDKL